MPGSAKSRPMGGVPHVSEYAGPVMQDTPMAPDLSASSTGRDCRRRFVASSRSHSAATV